MGYIWLIYYNPSLTLKEMYGTIIIMVTNYSMLMEDIKDLLIKLKTYEEKELRRKEMRVRSNNKNFFSNRCNIAKQNAKQKGIPFDITPEYLKSIWTGKCAISGEELDNKQGKRHNHTASIDRINPNLGYVKGNVAWVCYRLNYIKKDCTLEDIKLIQDYMVRRL